LPFLGNLLDFRRDALRYYSEWSRQYGDIVALRLGTWPAVLLNHSDYVEHVLVRNARNFIKFPFFFRHVREIFGQGLLTSEGELWHRQRRLAAPAFHAQRLAVYGDTTVRFTERMLESWRPGDLRDVHVETTAVKRVGIVATYSPYCCWDVMKKTSRCRTGNCGMR
jgi:cytochrome P450